MSPNRNSPDAREWLSREAACLHVAERLAGVGRVDPLSGAAWSLAVAGVCAALWWLANLSQ